MPCEIGQHKLYKVPLNWAAVVQTDRESIIYVNVDFWISEYQWSFNFHRFRVCWKRAYVSFKKTFQIATSETLKLTVRVQNPSWDAQFLSAGYIFWILMPKVSWKRQNNHQCFLISCYSYFPVTPRIYLFLLFLQMFLSDPSSSLCHSANQIQCCHHSDTIHQFI